MSPYPVADRGVRGGDSLNTNLVNEAMVGKSLSLIQDEINMKLEDYQKALKKLLSFGAYR